MKDIIDMADDYRWYAQRKCNAHYQICESARALNNRLGMPVTVLTAIVGTSIFATISSAPQLWLKVVTGLFSLTAAALSALHTWFRYQEVASQHREAAAEYGAIRHSLDHFLLTFGQVAEDQRPAALERFNEISKQLDMIEKKAPSIPDQIYDKVSRTAALKPVLGRPKPNV